MAASYYGRLGYILNGLGVFVCKNAKSGKDYVNLRLWAKMSK
jgi:hypothetical protein